MILDNEIKIKCTPNGDNSDIEMQYGKHLTVAELVTTLSLAKEQVLEIMKDYIKINDITSEEDIETIYWKMEIRHLL